MTEIYIFFGASMAVGLLAIVTFFIALSYHRVLLEQRRMEDEIKRLKAGRGAAVDEVLLTAQKEAREVLQNAELKAQELIRSSEIFSLEFKKNFQAGLGELIELEKSLYIETATGVQKESNKTLLKISEVLNSQLDSEMKSFHTAMVQETTRTRDSLNKSIQEVYEQAQTEALAYKKLMMERVNSVVFSIIEKTVKKSFGAVLSKDEHEKAIIKALEEAKASNVF